MSRVLPAVLPTALSLVLASCGGGGGGSSSPPPNPNLSPSPGGTQPAAPKYLAYATRPLAVLSDGKLVLQTTINPASGKDDALPGLLIWDPVSKALTKGIKFSLSQADLIKLAGANATVANTFTGIYGARSTPDSGLILSIDVHGPDSDAVTRAGKAHIYLKLDASLSIQWVSAFAPFEDWGDMEVLSDGFAAASGLRFNSLGALESAAWFPSYFSARLGSGNLLQASGSVVQNKAGGFIQYTGEHCFGNAASITADGGAIVAGYESSTSKFPRLCRTDAFGTPVRSVVLDHPAQGGGYGGFTDIVSMQGAYYAVSTHGYKTTTPISANWSVCKFTANLDLSHCIVSQDDSGIALSPIKLVPHANASRLYVYTAGTVQFAVLDSELNLVSNSGHTVGKLSATATAKSIAAPQAQALTPTDRLAQTQALRVDVSMGRLEIAPADVEVAEKLADLLR